MTISEVAESDWATAWKKYYHPVRVTRFLTIVPSWEAYHAQDEAEKLSHWIRAWLSVQARIQRLV